MLETLTHLVWLLIGLGILAAGAYVVFDALFISRIVGPWRNRRDDLTVQRRTGS